LPQLAAGEPTPPAKDEPIDPDILRKVRKLVQGTLAEDEAAREKAWTELRSMGNLAVPGLLGLYRQPETTPAMMRSILICLGDSKDPRAGPALLEMMRSKETSVRRDAARALGDSGWKDSVSALDALAANEKEEPEVRLFAGVAAAKMGSSKAIEVLAGFLQQQKPEIRSRAVFALGKYGGVSQISQLTKALDDEDQSVREDAVEALRGVGKKEVYPALVKATADGNYKVRNSAMDALKELTGEKLETPQAWREWMAKNSKQ
jgi:HEAT repeat protein